MKKRSNGLTAGLLAAVLVLTGTAQALFGLGKDKGKTVPETQTSSAQPLEIRVYQGVAFQGRLTAADSRGGTPRFSIVSQPKKGTVTLEGDRFTYTPKENVSGKDSFTYTATVDGVDAPPAAVRITIEKCRSGVRYADTPPAAATAAQYLAEKGIFTGAKIADSWYFEPQRAVSRGEFLAMALETVGVTVTPVGLTAFSDDAAIPTWARGYASAAVAQGIVKGRSTSRGVVFSCDDPISTSEAATILDRALKLGDVELSVWYADRQTVPSWAAQAVGNMEAMNVLAAGSFGSDALDSPVTRADAAEMLCAVGVLLQSRQ